MDGSVEVTGSGLNWTLDRIMLVDCSSTCGISSPSKSVLLGGEPQTLKVANEFLPKNEVDDLERQLDAHLPTELRTYTTVKDSYCRGGNLGQSDIGEAVWNADQCHNKCADCSASGAACPAECDGYEPEMDGPNTLALCLGEEKCRQVCSELGEICFGIDLYKYSHRCYLNMAGEANGCKDRYERGDLGSTAAYDFLAKSLTNAGQVVTEASGVSSSEILRFAPVGFTADAGKYKVCFCDAALLPAGQEKCLSESDYSLWVGDLYVSGVSCLLADPKFRRSKCNSMYHGGLACSNEVEYPATTGALPPSAGVPTSWASISF